METLNENVIHLHKIYYDDIKPLCETCDKLNCGKDYNELINVYNEIYSEEMNAHKIYMDFVTNGLDMMMLPSSVAFFSFQLQLIKLFNKISSVKEIILKNSCNITKRERYSEDEYMSIKKARTVQL